MRAVKRKSNTQFSAVKNYLLKHKKLSSWDAIQMFGATRLSGIIYDLRHEDKMKIKTLKKTVNNRYGNHTVIAIYMLEDKKRRLKGKAYEI